MNKLDYPFTAQFTQREFNEISAHGYLEGSDFYADRLVHPVKTVTEETRYLEGHPYVVKREHIDYDDVVWEVRLKSQAEADALEALAKARIENSDAGIRSIQAAFDWQATKQSATL
jgi:hypothetical protein